MLLSPSRNYRRNTSTSKVLLPQGATQFRAVWSLTFLLCVGVLSCEDCTADNSAVLKMSAVQPSPELFERIAGLSMEKKYTMVGIETMEANIGDELVLKMFFPEDLDDKELAGQVFRFGTVEDIVSLKAVKGSHVVDPECLRATDIEFLRSSRCCVSPVLQPR